MKENLLVNQEVYEFNAIYNKIKIIIYNDKKFTIYIQIFIGNIIIHVHAET